jgi:hypothetical protein
MGLCPSKTAKNTSVQPSLSMNPLPFPLSSRAKPRDLQFSQPALTFSSPTARYAWLIAQSVYA